MPDQYYSRSGPWGARWSLSRIARYCSIFVLGALTGRGSLIRSPEHQVTSNQEAIASTGHALDKQELDETVREAIRAEFEAFEHHILALETRIEASTDPAHIPFHESSRYLAHADQPPESPPSAVGGSSSSE